MSEKRTEIAEYGRFGLIDHLTKGFGSVNRSTVKGSGDDAAVLDYGERYTLLSSELLLEGIDFDLTYFPHKHLGYKAVVAAISRVIAMNGTPRHITVSLGVSAKSSVEQLEDLFSGIHSACEDYSVDLVGCDAVSSITGLSVAIAITGEVAKDAVAYRSGAQLNDLICITGNLGAAYMGLHLLEREKRAFSGNENPQPKFEGYEYILRRQLKPAARLDVIDSLHTAGIAPTSMTCLTDGLASDLLQICKGSGCGARIYLERIPIAKETHLMAEELKADPVVAALNGGSDYELLFTVPLSIQDQIARLGGIEIIGHITAQSTGAMLVTPDGNDITLQSPGFR